MKFQIKRLWSQILIAISANLGPLGLKTGFCFPFFYCNSCPAATSACPLRSIEKSVYNTLNFEAKSYFSWTLLLYPLLILGFFGSITGRAICGWACPIGLLQRGTGKVAKKFKKYPIIKKLGQHKAEHYFRFIKYLIFIGLVIVTSALIGFMFTDICPVGFLTGTIPTLILNPGKFIFGFYFWPAFVIIILFLILIFLVERGWCRYFCPVGAILAPFNKISLLHVDVDKTNCINCEVCSWNCPMGIDVPNMNRDPECIFCGKCMDVCPKKIISYKWM